MKRAISLESDGYHAVLLAASLVSFHRLRKRQAECSEIAVGIPITGNPPHRSPQAR